MMTTPRPSRSVFVLYYLCGFAILVPIFVSASLHISVLYAFYETVYMPETTHIYPTT